MKWISLSAAITALVLSGCNRNKEPEGTVFVSGRIDGDTVEISSKIPGRIVNLAELMMRQKLSGVELKEQNLLAANERE